MTGFSPAFTSHLKMLSSLGFATLNPTYKEMAKVLSQKPGFFFSREKPDFGRYRNRVSQRVFSFILTAKGETRFLFIVIENFSLLYNSRNKWYDHLSFSLNNWHRLNLPGFPLTRPRLQNYKFYLGNLSTRLLHQ